MNTIGIGDRVLANDEPIGIVVARIGVGPGGSAPSLVIRRDDGTLVEAAESLVTEHRDGVVRLAPASGTLAGAQVSTAGGAETGVHHLLLLEEALDPSVTPVSRGVVRLARRVETVPVEEVVQTWRDDVTVERVPVGRQIETIPAPRTEGDTLIVPIVEEMLVVERRLVLREEVRVTKRRVSESVRVTGEVRRQRLDVEHIAPASADACPE
ncbi:MAG: YsnF/AvaK domain-containing protein [Thermomicrobiales bacterium]|nr:YsnF/AvaK domain-containing protein [Thermomicrobiales bacterium]